jgi:hypothetical protein
MSDRKFEIGDTVKHIEQDIIGEILRIHYDTNEIVIKDLYSEYESPDDELVYRPNELELYKNQIGG